MPRIKKKPLGTRHYVNYSDEVLNECLQEINSGRMTQRAAAAAYKIPRSTIKNKLKGKHTKLVGRSRVFTDAEETSFEHHLIKLAEYEFPVIESDFRLIVQSFLNKKGVKIDVFKNNLPGYEWTKSFLKRHPNLSIRMSSNIKRVRAEVGFDDINSYMNNLGETIKDIPPSRIWNYDETNLSDNPGNKKVISKRGAKYVEKICNFSKSSTSVMFCGNAEGKLLAPYVVYKAENMWTTWTENGPEKTRYNRSKSGWFDSITFEDWFTTHFLKEIKCSKDYPTVLIGDNLASHINASY